MENDYLWDKTGDDAEIEELEKALQVFRYQESNAPLIPVKVVETKPKFSLFSLKFGLSFATCLAVLIGGFFVGSKLLQQPNLAETAISQNSIERPQIMLNKSDNELPPISAANPPTLKIAPRPINISYRQKEFSAPVTRKVKTRKVAPKIQLTDEEQYAYNQLMTALSITGSKLKEVKDKVNGNEEKIATIKSLK